MPNTRKLSSADVVIKKLARDVPAIDKTSFETGKHLTTLENVGNYRHNIYFNSGQFPFQPHSFDTVMSAPAYVGFRIDGRGMGPTANDPLAPSGYISGLSPVSTLPRSPKRHVKTLASRCQHAMRCLMKLEEGRVLLHEHNAAVHIFERITLVYIAGYNKDKHKNGGPSGYVPYLGWPRRKKLRELGKIVHPALVPSHIIVAYPHRPKKYNARTRYYFHIPAIYEPEYLHALKQGRAFLTEISFVDYLMEEHLL